jgi:hypothetical protein
MLTWNPMTSLMLRVNVKTEKAPSGEFEVKLSTVAVRMFQAVLRDWGTDFTYLAVLYGATLWCAPTPKKLVIVDTAPEGTPTRSIQSRPFQMGEYLSIAPWRAWDVEIVVLNTPKRNVFRFEAECVADPTRTRGDAL